jgi:hypothetical protein
MQNRTPLPYAVGMNRIGIDVADFDCLFFQVLSILLNHSLRTFNSFSVRALQGPYSTVLTIFKSMA